MKKILLTSLLMLISILGVNAQNTLNVYQKDGTITCYAFSEKPVAEFNGTDVIIRTNKTEITIPFSQIKEYTFEDGVVPSGILSIKGKEKVEPIKIYSAAGALLKTIEPKDNTTVETSLSDLPNGVYVIYNGKKTIKYPLNPQLSSNTRLRVDL